MAPENENSDDARTAIGKKTSRKTASVIAALGLVYGLFFLPELVLGFLKTQLHSVGTLLATMGCSGTLAAILGSIIAGQDILATTKVRSARFFRAQFPSEEIRKRYTCTQAEANQLWFEHIFNPLANKTHRRHAQYLMTFERSYNCRFIFYLRWALVLVALLAAVTWFLSWKFGFESAADSSQLFIRQYTRWFLLAMAVVIAGALFLFNRLTPTGCWLLWQEINDIHKAWLQKAVFAAASTYDAALKLVQDPTWKQNEGYK
jgi:hypothetical protein